MEINNNNKGRRVVGLLAMIVLIAAWILGTTIMGAAMSLGEVRGTEQLKYFGVWLVGTLVIGFIANIILKYTYWYKGNK